MRKQEQHGLGPHESKFLDVVQGAGSLYASVDIRVLAVKIEGQWHNLVTMAEMRPKPQAKIPRITPLLTERIGVWQSVLPIRRLSHVLDSIRSGRLVVNKRTIHYVEGAFVKDRQRRAYHFNEPFFYDVIRRSRRNEPRWSYHVLFASGDRGQEILRHGGVSDRQIDSQLKALDPPYDGLVGVAESLVGARHSFLDQGTYVNIIAPLEAKLDPEACRFEDGRLFFEIVSGSDVAAQRCVLTCTIHRDGRQVAIRRADGAMGHWQEHSEGLTWHGQLDLPASESAKLYLKVAGEHATQFAARNFGARSTRLEMRLYQTVDPDLKYIRKSLTKPGGSDVFEAAVGRLFAILGFTVLPLTCDSRLSDGVDVLAVDRVSGTLLAIECTLQSLDTQGKLGKLKVRTHTLTSALPDLRVRGVVVSAVERGGLSNAEIEKAGEDMLAVLSQEDLLRLVEFALESQPTNMALEYIKSRVSSESAKVLSW